VISSVLLVALLGASTPVSAGECVPQEPRVGDDGHTKVGAEVGCQYGERLSELRARVYWGHKGAYQDGEQHGVWTTWWDVSLAEKGGDLPPKKQEEGPYVAGKKHGTWREWYINGTPKRESEWVQGELHGPWTEWYPGAPGRKKEQGTYQKGKKHGTWTTWRETGQVQKTLEWTNGLDPELQAQLAADAAEWMKLEAERKAAREAQRRAAQEEAERRRRAFDETVEAYLSAQEAYHAEARTLVARIEGLLGCRALRKADKARVQQRKVPFAVPATRTYGTTLLKEHRSVAARGWSRDGSRYADQAELDRLYTTHPDHFDARIAPIETLRQRVSAHLEALALLEAECAE
jgi:hypothetical protein